MGLPKDIAASPEEFQADDFCRGEKSSVSASSSPREVKNFSVKDLRCLSAAENRLENADISDKDAISEMTASTVDGNLEKEDASAKDHTSDLSLKMMPPIHKITQQLSSVKKAKRKYDSKKKEKNTDKAKRRRKDVIPDASPSIERYFQKVDVSNENVISDVSPSMESDPEMVDVSPSMEGDPEMVDVSPSVESDPEKVDVFPSVKSYPEKVYVSPSVESDPEMVDVFPFVESYLEMMDVSPSVESDLEKVDVFPSVESDPEKVDVSPSMENDPEKVDVSPSVESDPEKVDVSNKNVISDVPFKKTLVIPKRKSDSKKEKNIFEIKGQCEEVSSDIPSSTAGEHSLEEEASDKDVVSDIPLKSLRIPKVVRRLSAKNAICKYDSLKEKTNDKRKRQRKRLLKNLPLDEDFLSREGNGLDSGTDDEDVRLHECKICQRAYVHEKSLLRHMKTHSKKAAFKCQICDAVFYEAFELKKHKRTHDGIRPYSCDECPASFTQQSALYRHRKIHTAEKRFHCDACGMRFAQNSSLKRHRKCHEQKKTFKCTFCETIFNEKQHLESHVNALHGDVSEQEQKEFKCEVCSKVFLRYSNYYTHKKGHDKNARDAYKCEQCNKTFATKSNLTRHCNYQHEKTADSVVEKPYPCTVCDEQFSRNASLKQHMRSHDKQGVFRCDICTKTFATKYWFRKHMALHKSNGIHCERCLRTFRSHFRLQLHKRKMGDKCIPVVDFEQAKIASRRYACKYCDAKLSMRKRLAKHIRKSHPDVETYICDVCDKGFCYYLDLLTHRKIHRYIPYQCKTCQLAFPRYVELMEHYLDETHVLKTSAKSKTPEEDQSSVSDSTSGTNIVDNSSQQIIGSEVPEKPVVVASCSETQLESSTTIDGAADETHVLKTSAKSKTPEEDQSSVSDSTSGTNILDNSSQQVIGCDVPEKPVVVASCSETQPESSTMIDGAASKADSNSANLRCQICSVVFLATVHYRAHCTLVHGETRYHCQKCGTGFNYFTRFRIHMRTFHPVPKKPKRKKKKKSVIIKPKVAPKLDPVKLEQLLKARVKEAMKKSKSRLSGSNKKAHGRNRPKSFVID